MTRVKEIPKKNYLIFATIVCFTLAISITAYIIYNNQKKYENSIPVVRGKMSEIETKDLDEFLRENPNALLYIGVANDDNSRRVEEDLLDLKEKKNLNIIYVNITELKNKKGFYKSFNKKYGNEHELKDYPAFIIMREGKVFDLCQRNNGNFNIEDIQQLIDIYEIEGESND